LSVQNWFKILEGHMAGRRKLIDAAKDLPAPAKAAEPAAGSEPPVKKDGTAKILMTAAIGLVAGFFLGRFVRIF
jgi:hypothetical protein